MKKIRKSVLMQLCLVLIAFFDTFGGGGGSLLFFGEPDFPDDVSQNK